MMDRRSYRTPMLMNNANGGDAAAPPHQLHPAAADAAAAFSDALSTAEKLKTECADLAARLAASEKYCEQLERMLNHDRQALILWQRYGTQITTRLRSIEEAIQAAKQSALEFADAQPKTEIVSKLEKEIADEVAAQVSNNTDGAR